MNRNENPDYPGKLIADLHLNDILGMNLNYWQLTPDQLLGLEHMLLLLPMNELILIRQHYQEAVSLEKIASIYRMSEGQVRRNLDKALRTLQRPERLLYIANGWNKQTSKLEEQISSESEEYMGYLSNLNQRNEEIVLRQSYRFLGLSTRANGCLRGCRVRTVLDTVLLVQDSCCSKSVRNMGPLTVKEIISKLQELKLIPLSFEPTQIEEGLPEKDFCLAAYQHLNQCFDDAIISFDQEQVNMVSTA